MLLSPKKKKLTASDTMREKNRRSNIGNNPQIMNKLGNRKRRKYEDKYLAASPQTTFDQHYPNAVVLISKACLAMKLSFLTMEILTACCIMNGTGASSNSWSSSATIHHDSEQD